MGKSKPIYVWDNIDNKTQRTEPQIYFIYHTTNLYGSQFYSKYENQNMQKNSLGGVWENLRKQENIAD